MKPINVILTLLIGTVVGEVVGWIISACPTDETGLRRHRKCPACSADYTAAFTAFLREIFLRKEQCPHCGRVQHRSLLPAEILNPLLWLACLFAFRERTAVCIALFMAAVSVLLCILFLGLRTEQLPIGFPITLFALGIASAFIDHSLTLPERVMGMVLGGGFFLLCLLLARGILKQDGLSRDDIRIMAAAGLLVGWRDVFMAIVFAAACAALVLAVVSVRKGNKGMELPFTPFLCTGTIISLLIGQQLLRLYISLFQFH